MISVTVPVEVLVKYETGWTLAELEEPSAELEKKASILSTKINVKQTAASFVNLTRLISFDLFFRFCI
jgi:hypothetical protein